MIKFSIQFHISLFGKDWRMRKSKDNGQDFVQVATQTIDSLTDIRAKSTLDNYRTALSSFNAYLGKPIALQAISSLVLEGYQRWLTEKGISQNTISCYMRSLRSLIGKMQPEADVHKLFGSVFTGKERTEKRALPIEDICRLQRLTFPPKSPLAFSRDLFLFSFYALGMPFVDMACLRKSQISNGYIVYHRHKTGQRISIKIEPQMTEIICRYQLPDDPYVFPILNATATNALGTEYETARARYNRHLYQLGKIAQTQRKLTSYVARHSWATAAYHANISLSVISRALGHTSPNTTQTYLQAVDDQRIDAANNKVLQQVHSKTLSSAEEKVLECSSGKNSLI